MSLTRWFLTFLSFPIGGGIATLVVGSVDGPIPAILAGLVAGTVIGIAQWLALRPVGVSARWTVLTAAGMAAGSGIASVVTDAGTTVSELVVGGLVVGAVVGAVQAFAAGLGRNDAAVWTVVVSIVWALGWFITANVIVDAERGYVSFGASGAIVVTVVTGLVLRRLLGHRPTDLPVIAAATASR